MLKSSLREKSNVWKNIFLNYFASYECFYYGLVYYLDSSELKAFVDDQADVAQITEFVFNIEEKKMRKKRKCIMLLEAFTPLLSYIFEENKFDQRLNHVFL